MHPFSEADSVDVAAMHIVKELIDPSTDLDEHDQYRQMADLIPVLAWIANADGSIHWYNRRWYEYTGTTFEEMQGWGWRSVHDASRLPFVLARWQASIRDGKPFEMTFPLKGADGVFRPFLTRVVPLRNNAGRVVRWFGTNTDIAEELCTSAALRDSEQRFRVATEAISGILWTNTPEGELQGEQPAWSEFTGQTPEEYRGYGWASAVHPEDAQPSIDAWQEAVRESRLFSFEHRVRRHDGVYRLCSVRALPVRNDDGSVREWVGVHTDITEDRKRQEALRETVAALRRQEEVIETAEITHSVGFWRYHPTKDIHFVSAGARHLVGLPLEGDIPVDVALDRVHPDDVARVTSALADAAAAGHYVQEFRTPATLPGEFRWILSTGRLLHDETGDPYLVGMNLDITQQKLSSEALIRTEKLAAVGRLASTIAHEINNPLEAVTNLLYLVLQSPLSEEQRTYCTTMMSELRHISEIATHTLRFHRQSTKATETRIDTLLQTVLTLFEGKIRNAGITVDLRTSEEHTVHGFDGEIRQVFANLAGNAIDAMNAAEIDPRRLSIRTHRGHHPRTGVAGISVLIADTGCGIAPAVLERIFEPFFTTKGEVGTGLGLWVSSEIVHKHHGTIRFRSSQGPGARGAVARVFLPLRTAV